MGPPKKRLSDTDEALVAIASEAGGEAGAQKVLSELTPSAGTPKHGESSEHLRLIARDVVSSHERDCLGLERIERWAGEMQKTLNTHSEALNQYLGEKKFKRFIQPMLIGFIGSAAGVSLAALLLKGLLLSVIKSLP
jgi:hypothetical protein